MSHNTKCKIKYFTIHSVLICHFPPTVHSRASSEISCDVREGDGDDRGFGRSGKVEDIIVPKEDS